MTTVKFGDIDYKNNLFGHPEISRIIGEATVASLTPYLQKSGTTLAMSKVNLEEDPMAICD